MTEAPLVKFYMKRGRWKVKALVRPTPAREWWDAINRVKCMNFQLRLKERTK